MTECTNWELVVERWHCSGVDNLSPWYCWSCDNSLVAHYNNSLVPNPFEDLKVARAHSYMSHFFRGSSTVSFIIERYKYP